VILSSGQKMEAMVPATNIHGVTTQTTTVRALNCSMGFAGYVAVCVQLRPKHVV
jgi:hypothetical protein